MKIALMVSCLVDTLTPRVGQATVTVLEGLGHDVVFPEAQTCCGQMHVNSGYPRQALSIARRSVAVFADPSYDAIVSPSASCVATVRHQYQGLAQLAEDRAFAEEIDALAPRVHELSEFLVGTLGVEDVGAVFPHRVAYHPSCHSLRGLKVGDAPHRLLSQVREIELVDLPGAESCCGFGGTFAVKNADTSAAMLADKLQGLTETGAEVCTAVDSSCLLQIGGGAQRQRLGVRVLHLAEILASGS